MVRSIGADHVVDYTREDFATSGQHYDLILSTAGYRSILDYRRALSPQGTYVSAGGAIAQVYQGMLLGPLISIAGSKRLTFLYAKQDQQDLVFLKELVESGKIKSVIDRRYPLSDVPEALRYYGEGRSRGKVVITVRAGEG
jgi:NADPH:quinone reductase-like Zn-dependent oxidoreductase